ncbi:riboflavin synthase [bacterium]|nr:riboflavin synthase [bacterium]
MFTGIVEGMGTIVKVEDGERFRTLWIETKCWSHALAQGSSVSINGCCTTVIESWAGGFRCELMSITLDKTNLGLMRADSRVNVERPLNMGADLGGHLVQGHIDGVGHVLRVTEVGENREIEISIPKPLRKYFIPTGSISVDGVSMTIAELKDESFVMGVIPHTWEVTVFSQYRVGTVVNLEADMIGKYIERLFPEALRTKVEEKW